MRRFISPLRRSIGLVTGMRCLGANVPAAVFYIVAYGATIGTEAREHEVRAGRCYSMSRELELVAGRLRLARLRWERESVVVVSPAAPVICLAGGANATGDWHRRPPNFRRGGVLGGRQAPTCGPHRYDADCAGGFGKTLLASDEVVVEATANSMAVSRVLAPFVARVIIAHPLQVKAIAQAHVKTDKIDAGTLASLQAAGYLPQVVRHRTRLK